MIHWIYQTTSFRCLKQQWFTQNNRIFINQKYRKFFWHQANLSKYTIDLISKQRRSISIFVIFSFSLQFAISILYQRFSSSNSYFDRSFVETSCSSLRIFWSKNVNDVTIIHITIHVVILKMFCQKIIEISNKIWNCDKKNRYIWIMNIRRKSNHCDVWFNQNLIWRRNFVEILWFEKRWISFLLCKNMIYVYKI